MNANERRRTGPAVLNRVLGYMLHYYKYLFILVIGCILVSAVCLSLIHISESTRH